MKEVIIIDPIKDERWDAFVESHPYGWICHLSGWKKALEKSFQQMKGHYLLLIDTSNNTIQAALPLFELKSWLTGNRLVSIPFATLCDPLISTSTDMEILFESALKLSRELRISHIEIRTLSSSELIKDARLYMHSYYKHHFLLLDIEPEQLKKSFHRTCVRQRIDRSLKSNLNLRLAENEIDLQKFYCLYMKTRKRLGLPLQPYVFIKSIWEIFLPSNRISILLAEKEEKAVAGLILFKFKNRVSVELSVSDEAFRNISPIHYLFWKAIESAYNEGYKIIDFGRTSPSNVGLMDFKNRWGTKVMDLSQFYYPRQADRRNGKREESIGYKMVQKVCRKAPDFALPYIGNFIYRHLG